MNDSKSVEIASMQNQIARLLTMNMTLIAILASKGALNADDLDRVGRSIPETEPLSDHYGAAWQQARKDLLRQKPDA